MNEQKISISDIKSHIPKDCFVKDPIIGLRHILFDFSCWGATIGLYYASSILPINGPLQIGVKVVYWLSSGFFMWCQFMNGHDCGHGSFSDSPLLNTIMGHISHTPLLVPFSTWALSHKRHHNGHNHIEKDYSHPFTIDPAEKWWVLSIQYTGLYPIAGWLYYMLGYPDGGHWIPFGGRLWNEKYDWLNHLHSGFSSVLIGSWVYFVFAICQYNFYVFIEWYGMSWLVFAWWLTTVTYLQHHDNTVDDTVVFGPTSWTFLRGALQTVDRSYGSWIDRRTHHITNCHLIHHLFIHIPHYHLERATHHLYKYLKENGVEYKYRPTPYFFLDIFKYTFLHMSEVTFTP
jgi:acyl-lipid omega-3 desaturase